jgi:hypothetical protein
MPTFSRILETSFTHIDLHDPATVAGFMKLISAVRQDTLEEAARLVEKSYYMDEDGTEPMPPEKIANCVRRLFANSKSIG